MPIPSGALVPFPGADSVVHNGHSRYNALNDKYIHNVSTGDAGGTGGSLTHTDISQAHNHTDNSHTNTFTAGAGSVTVRIYPGVTSFATTTHTHASTASNATTTTNQAATVTFNAVSNDPAYITVIWKVADGTAELFPGAWAFSDSATPPAGFSNPASPKNKYLKGAAAGADGGTTGGSNIHAPTALPHLHIKDPHGHTEKNSSVNTGSAKTGAPSTWQDAALKGHVHSVSLGSTTSTMQNTTITTISTENNEPVYQKLLIIQNDTGTYTTPVGTILPFSGARASIPADWAALTFAQDFVKCANDGTEIGTTGGSLTHLHTDTDDTGGHGHINDAHGVGHTPSSNFSILNNGDLTGATSLFSSARHVHSWTVGNATITTNGAVITMNTCASKAAYPQYVEVILIKKLPSGRVCYLPLLGAG